VAQAAVVPVGLEPLVGCMLRTLWAVPVATGMMDAGVLATTLALIQAVAGVSALARLDGTDDRAVCEGQLGGALQVFWRKSRADLAEGRHGRRPCMRALRRS
jgi:hypothetical protein